MAEPRETERDAEAPAGAAAETRTEPSRFLGARGLTAQQFREALGAVDFAVDARYAWDTGIAVGEFLRGLRSGRILARECRVCRRVLVPPRMFCEQCFRPTDRWVEVRDTGRVNTFSICHVAWDMTPLEEPEIPAVIEIDGASRGVGFMHKVGEVDPKRVAIGMEVEAVWRPEEEREASILDIRYFRPRDPSLRRPPGSPRAQGGGG